MHVVAPPWPSSFEAAVVHHEISTFTPVCTRHFAKQIFNKRTLHAFLKNGPVPRFSKNTSDLNRQYWYRVTC